MMNLKENWCICWEAFYQKHEIIIEFKSENIAL